MSKLLFKKVQIDALFEAICESNLTPYFVVDTAHPDVLVPMNYVNEAGFITLSMAAKSVQNFTYDDTGFMYTASFGGIPQTIIVPYESIAAVYPLEDPKSAFSYPRYEPEPEPKKPEPAVGVEPTTRGYIGWEKSAIVIH